MKKQATIAMLEMEIERVQNEIELKLAEKREAETAVDKHSRKLRLLRQDHGELVEQLKRLLPPSKNITILEGGRQ